MSCTVPISGGPRVHLVRESGVQWTVYSVQWRQLHPVAVLLSWPCHELVLVTHSTPKWTPATPLLLSSSSTHSTRLSRLTITSVTGFRLHFFIARHQTLSTDKGKCCHQLTQQSDNSNKDFHFNSACNVDDWWSPPQPRHPSVDYERRIKWPGLLTNIWVECNQ